MRGAAVLAERAATFVFLVLFAGIMWPPDAYFAGTMQTPQGASNIYDFSEFAALLGFLALGFFAQRRALLPLATAAWPVLLLVALAFLSALWSDDPALVVRRAGTVTLTTLFGVYLAARGDLAGLVADLVKVYAIAVLASFVAIALLPQAATVTGDYYTHAWRGAFTDKNELGMACGEAIIVAVYALRRGYGARWLAVFTLLGGLVLLAGSQSKTPILVMLGALYAALVAMALRRRSAAGLAVGYALVVGGLASGALLAVGWQDALTLLGRDPTFTNRTRIWQLAAEYIARRPWLGYGFESFFRADSADANLIWAAVGFKTPHAHNSWLEIGLGMGLIGIGAAALAWLVAFYRTLRVVAAPRARHVAFCLALLAGVFLENLSEFEFFRPGRLMWALFVAVLVYLGRELPALRAAGAEARRAGAVARRALYAPARHVPARHVPVRPAAAQ
ncbi:MAG TPA: O-antigen ligase family protein [Stellaceae bacterium]|nr:O-antigen ligase family protein [Stellaceae bacterium]